MNTLLGTLQYFVIIMFELAVLFIGISALVELTFMYVSQDKFQKWMSDKGVWGNIMGVLFGAVTPFCACSTVPLTVGFLQAGVPFGAVMSFLISSPLMDPLIFMLLGAFLGWKAALGFLLLTSAFAVVFGALLDKLGWADQVKNVRVRGDGQGECQQVPAGFKSRLKTAFLKAWDDFRGVFVYMVIGVGIGAAIYGYMPADLLARVAGRDNPFGVLVTAVIGMPLYIRVESAIPIGLALLNKGASIGAVIAFIISGAGIAIPELTMLASIFKPRIVVAFIVIVFVTAIMSGLIFNLLI